MTGLRGLQLTAGRSPSMQSQLSGHAGASTPGKVAVLEDVVLKVIAQVDRSGSANHTRPITVTLPDGSSARAGG